MLLRSVSRAAALLLLAAVPARAADYSLKVVDNSPAPKEVPEPIRKLLGERCLQLLDGKGEALAEVWLRKEVPAKATEAQIKNGLSYREIPETTLLGVLRTVKPLSDYRKQTVPAGVYTLRLAYQPQDGDHMGTAPYNEFCLVSPIADDKGAPTMAPKALHEMSAKATNNHPGVFLLFPGKEAADQPKLVNKGDGHWTIFAKQDVVIGDKKTTLGIGLTLIGKSPSA